MTALAVTIMAALYFARDALIVIYISALVAIGFGPVVRAIEHQTPRPGRQQADAALAGDPGGLSRDHRRARGGRGDGRPAARRSGASSSGATCRRQIDRAQRFLIDRGLITRRITFEEAVQSAPRRHDGRRNLRRRDRGNRPRHASPRASFGFVTIRHPGLLSADRRAIRCSPGSRGCFPVSAARKSSAAGDEISTKVSAWMTGQLILGGTIGATSALGLYLLGVPYFYVLALISAVGELIPVVGPILAAVPAIGVAFSRVATDRVVGDRLLRRPAAGREPPARAQDHGAAGWRQRGRS